MTLRTINQWGLQESPGRQPHRFSASITGASSLSREAAGLQGTKMGRRTDKLPPSLSPFSLSEPQPVERNSSMVSLLVPHSPS